ncbi:uncharacterized protein C8Q71DRAFT_797831 [Rhodofomes roseus]|uniref:Uncharacterized protein n=1 Tax=Rhodofomes roseus TaxID=34475 RepID=A0ABQ8KBF6_9APHY|nr:uncharacterized protein C8Q71DRAFT_797831 [Rhodofomes roseus]KAH9834599.1 hypothetical protein C8Q71DRAFT_797831 [Rhodofomes roseus]
MSVFNPKILDACIRDVTASLPDEQKADVLLHAMGQLPLERSRLLIENAVQSCLSLNGLSVANAAKARLMRARARLAAGLHVGAHQDLQAVMAIEPEHPEARALMVHHVANSGKSLIQPHTTPGFSTEIWREIARWLPPRDLKNVLLVPHILSRIASELLFRKIDLFFVPDKRESQRSADILTRVIVDKEFAKHVKTLRVFYQGRDVSPMTFQTGMLANALPKLVNLRNVHCSMRLREMLSFLRILESANHRLRGMSLMWVQPLDGTAELQFPRFRHITQFSYVSTGGNPADVQEFLQQNKPSIRSIFLHNQHWTFPSETLSIRNLTNLDFLGLFPSESRAFADILSNGHQLESLRLQCVLNCNASAQFREGAAAHALPFLRHFEFTLLGYNVNDHDLFPAISAFLRDRRTLKTLVLSVPSANWAQKRLGYDAGVWGVLPSLTELKALTATLPKDVAAAVAMWLVPRGVTALSLQAEPSTDAVPFVSQMRPGLPPNLSFMGLSQFEVKDVAAVVEAGFPMVRVVRVDDDYYTVERLEDGRVKMQAWPEARGHWNIREWLQSYGCEDAEWRHPSEFL